MRAITIFCLMVGAAASGPAATAAAGDLVTAITSPRLAQTNPAPRPEPRFCAQVISCGTKNGVRKEYPTPCAAQDDGATNIAPKSGASY